MSRRGRHEEHPNHERWLVSYADLITLLFAFFVIMYSISQADIRKFKAVAEGMKHAFSPAPAGAGPAGGASAPSIDPFERAPVPEQPAGSFQGPFQGKASASPEQDARLRDLQAQLEESISLDVGTSDLADQVGITQDARGLVLRLAIRDLYAPGSAELARDFRPLLDRVGRVIARFPGVIRIEGHADLAEDDAAREKGFANEWELSAARASSLAELWNRRFGIPGERVMVIGRSRFQPLNEGGGPLARAGNRRVEVILER